MQYPTLLEKHCRTKGAQEVIAAKAAEVFFANVWLGIFFCKGVAR